MVMGYWGNGVMENAQTPQFNVSYWVCSLRSPTPPILGPDSRPRYSAPILGPDTRDGFAEMASPRWLRRDGFAEMASPTPFHGIPQGGRCRYAPPRCSGCHFVPLALRWAYGTTERKSYPTDLTDAQWQRIEPLLPLPKPGGRPRTTNLREVISGILYLLRSGCPWRMLPHDFPPWGTVWYYFRRWRIDGIWHRIHTRADYFV